MPTEFQLFAYYLAIGIQKILVLKKAVQLYL